jgi:hypothetical protein
LSILLNLSFLDIEKIDTFIPIFFFAMRALIGEIINNAPIPARMDTPKIELNIEIATGAIYSKCYSLKFTCKNQNGNK